MEALGLHLLSHHHHVAVLAIDPSSEATGGAILGDKLRMPRWGGCKCVCVSKWKGCVWVYGCMCMCLGTGGLCVLMWCVYMYCIVLVHALCIDVECTY